MASTDKRTRTAYHEAGHVVVGLFLGPGWVGDDRFDHATIVPDGTTLGRVAHGPLPSRFADHRFFDRLGDMLDPDPRTDYVAMGLLMGGLAGVLAEVRLIELEGREPTDEENREIDEYLDNDLDIKKPILAHLACDDAKTADALVEYLRAKLMPFLSWPYVWERVEAVAAALLDRETLSYEECKAILASMGLPDLELPERSNAPVPVTVQRSDGTTSTMLITAPEVLVEVMLNDVAQATAEAPTLGMPIVSRGRWVSLGEVDNHDDVQAKLAERGMTVDELTRQSLERQPDNNPE